MEKKDFDLTKGVAVIFGFFAAIIIAGSVDFAMGGNQSDEYPTFVNEEVAAVVEKAGISSTPYERSVKSESNDEYFFEIGKSYKLKKNIVVGNTKAHLKEMYNYVANKNNDAVLLMVLMGQGDILDSNPIVSIVEYSGRAARLLIIDDCQYGIYNGYEVYAYLDDMKTAQKL